MDRAAVVVRENSRETIAGKVGYEAALLIYQRNGRLKNMIERNGQLFCAFGTLLHESVCQSGESAEVYKHGVGVQMTL